jgi:hypothetical protein
VCIVSRGTASPVVDVANRIGHNQRPATQRGSSSGTRPEEAAQGGVLFSLWTINAQLQTSACMQPDPSECPLFDRPKRGRKKPHQPALAHYVRVAGLHALRLTAMLCVGAANRKGPKGHPVDSLGHLRWPRSNIDSRCAPLRRSAVRDTAPRKARKTNRRQNERKAGRRYRFFLRRKGSRLGGDLNPRLGFSNETHPSQRTFLVPAIPLLKQEGNSCAPG